MSPYRQLGWPSFHHRGSGPRRCYQSFCDPPARSFISSSLDHLRSPSGCCYLTRISSFVKERIPLRALFRTQIRCAICGTIRGKKKNRGSFSIFCDFLRLCFRLPRVQGPRRKISRLARTTRELVLVNPVLEGRTQTRIRWRSKGVQRRLGRAPWAGEFINAGKASESDLLPIMEETGCKKRKQAISAAQQEEEKGQRSGEENGGGNGKKPEPPGELWVFNSPEACSPRPSWSWFCRHHLCSALMAFYESLESLNGFSPTRDHHGDHW